MRGDPTVRGLVAEIGALVAIEGGLFTIVGGWVADTADDGLAVRFATVSRELGEHATWWRDVLPESVLLEPESTIVPGPTWGAALDAAAGLTGDAARATALHLLLLPGVADVCRALPADERFVRRVRDRVLADVLDAVVDGAVATARVCADPAAVAAATPGTTAVAVALRPAPEAG